MSAIRPGERDGDTPPNGATVADGVADAAPGVLLSRDASNAGGIVFAPGSDSDDVIGWTVDSAVGTTVAPDNGEGGGGGGDDDDDDDGDAVAVAVAVAVDVDADADAAVAVAVVDRDVVEDVIKGVLVVVVDVDDVVVVVCCKVAMVGALMHIVPSSNFALTRLVLLQLVNESSELNTEGHAYVLPYLYPASQASSQLATQ